MSFFHDKGVIRGAEVMFSFLKNEYPTAFDGDINKFLTHLKENLPDLFTEDGRQVISEDRLKLLFIESL